MKIPEELVVNVQQARTTGERVDRLTELVLLVIPEIELFLNVWRFSKEDREAIRQLVLGKVMRGIDEVKPSCLGRWLYCVASVGIGKTGRLAKIGSQSYGIQS